MNARALFAVTVFAFALATTRASNAAPCAGYNIWEGKGLVAGEVRYDVARRTEGGTTAEALIAIAGKGTGTITNASIGTFDETTLTCTDGGDHDSGKAFPDHVFGCLIPAPTVPTGGTVTIGFHVDFGGGSSCDFQTTLDTAKITKLPISNNPALATNPYTGKPYTLGDVLFATFLYDAAFDVDRDGVFGFDDNCRFTANPDQADANADGIGDACDPDQDGIMTELGDNCPDTANGDGQMD
ncbi:MAG: thrombospondin type 3 repeat-containing protein, partial [Deltaproteobacteria bacterium]|nr:thrombospondin type 3 repeat-containing protein [Deltaproteobacteria bacterium]